MLDNYKDKQSSIYHLFMNQLNNNKISHAYLIDENDNLEAFDFVMSFVKAILCNNVFDKIKYDLIDSGNYPELKIIEPDGMYIKKGQLLDLQYEFSRSSVYGNKRIYIIRDCEMMRPEAANAILKFLEEPVNDVVAILMTNNYNIVLPTIISRCQIVKLMSNKTVEKNITAVEKDEYKIAFEFIKNIEIEGIRTIINEKELWFNYVGNKDRDKMIRLIDIMIDIYYDILKLFDEIEISNDNLDYLDIKSRNNRKNIIDKINFLIESRDSIKFNVNSNLLISNIILSIGGNNGSSRN